MAHIPLPWRLFGLCVSLGVVSGAIFGFVRGLDYLPTLVFAVVEGATCSAFPLA